MKYFINMGTFYYLNGFHEGSWKMSIPIMYNIILSVTTNEIEESHEAVFVYKLPNWEWQTKRL